MHTLVLLYMGDETVTASAGTERVLTNMANAFTERGYHVIVATNDPPQAVPYFPFLPQVELIFLNVCQVKIPLFVKLRRELNRVVPLWDRPIEAYRARLSAKKLQQRLSGRQVDCVVAYNHEAVQVADFWQKGKCPLIAMMHNSIRVIMGRSNRATLQEKEKADVIQVLMPSYVEEAKQYIHHTPVVWIPNVVAPVSQEKQAHPGDRKTQHIIITIGRIDAMQKQTHILVQAFALLAEAYPQWQVEIWGEIKKKAYYEELCHFVEAHHLEKRLRFCGTTRDVQGKLQKADIFAFSSSYEGFPLALTEAMGMGLPAVGFRSADAVKDLIVDGRNGFLCEDGVVAFAHGLERLMKDGSLRAQFGRQAIEDMRPYAPSVIWDKWQKLIEQQIQRASHQKE